MSKQPQERCSLSLRHCVPPPKDANESLSALALPSQSGTSVPSLRPEHSASADDGARGSNVEECGLQPAQNLRRLAAMAYFIDLLSPETYEAFGRSDRAVSGFRMRHKGIAERVRQGDLLVCYVTRVSRWCGLLEVIDGPFIDSTPRFVAEEDPFVVRFHVIPKVWLSIEHSLPIHDDKIWKDLSFTQKLDKRSTAWTGKVRGSLVQLDDGDGALLTRLLSAQASAPAIYALDDADRKKFTTNIVNRSDKVVSVSVPEDAGSDDKEEPTAVDEGRESIRIQSLIAQIGARMGLSIWIPKADRGGVLKQWTGDQKPLLERLPLNYDDVTLRTIEQIDVIWLRGRSIVRAFEVEQTTSVYSGILRMADLLALQPNMDIKLHIAAPAARREKVFQEIRRPVFSLLEKGPLADSCTYLSYDSLRELAQQKHLDHLSDTVLDEYSEVAE
jgi:hypothetical protein